MSIINSLIKIFVGDKAKNDLKAIQPIVEKIKTYASQLENISNDELRAKTIEFKQRIKDARAQFDNKIAELEAQANATDDIDAKEDLYAEVDKLNGEAYQASEKALNEILPEAFATMKETARRFANNETITVIATEHDRELSATHDYVTIEGDKAVWKTTGTPLVKMLLGIWYTTMYSLLEVLPFTKVRLPKCKQGKVKPLWLPCLSTSMP